MPMTRRPADASRRRRAAGPSFVLSLSSSGLPTGILPVPLTLKTVIVPRAVSITAEGLIRPFAALAGIVPSDWIGAPAQSIVTVRDWAGCEDTSAAITSAATADFFI